MQNSVVSTQILAKIYRSWLKECDYHYAPGVGSNVGLRYFDFVTTWGFSVSQTHV